MTIVVESHSNVPSASGKSVGMVYADTSSWVTFGIIVSYPFLNELSDSVLRNRGDDPFAVGFAAQQRLRKFFGLADRNFRRHRRLERIDDRFDNDRAWRIQGLLDKTAAVVRIFDGYARSSAGLSKQCKVDRLQFASVFRIAEE